MPRYMNWLVLGVVFWSSMPLANEGLAKSTAPPMNFAGDYVIEGVEADRGTIVVVGFGEEADWVHRPFFDYTSFQSLDAAGNPIFTTDLSGQTAESGVSSVKFDDKSKLVDPVALAITVPVGAPRAIEVPLWPAPGFGRVWARADNAGQGYVVTEPGDVLVINLNYEIARSAAHHVDARMDGAQATFAIPESLEARLEGVHSLLVEASAALDEPARAAKSDVAFAEAIKLGEDLEFEVARQRIPSARMGSLPVRVVDPDGAPVSGATVRFRQVDHQFLFGAVQSFGFVNEDFSRETLDDVFRAITDAGLNHYTAHLSWFELEEEPNTYRLEEWDTALGVPSAVAAGMSLKLHSLLQNPMPDGLSSADVSTLRDRLTRFSRAVIDFYKTRYADRVATLEIANEPSMYQYGGSSQVEIGLLKDLSSLARSRWPEVPIMVNDVHFDMGQRYGDDSDYQHIISPLESFRQLNGNSVDYDRVGLQWYPGLQVNFYGIIKIQGPLKDLFRTSMEWEQFAELGKPVHITEFTVPSSFRDSWDSGWWRRKWTPQVQADFVERMYTLAFSKPHIHEITYWGITDHEPWVVTGGLMEESLRPKPVLATIQRLIQSWTTTGETTTDANGVAIIQGFGGRYEIDIEKAGVRGVSEASIFEQTVAAETTVVLPVP